MAESTATATDMNVSFASNYMNYSNSNSNILAEETLIVKVKKQKRRSQETQWKAIEFRILGNKGGGDCLFITLADYVGKLQYGTSYLDVLHDQMRKKVVAYIVKPDDATSEPGKYSTWLRYRQAIKFTLERHHPFFRDFQVDNKDPLLEAQAREEYQKYMGKVGVYGTYVEACAAMEIYGFSTTLIEKAPGSANRYYVCHLEIENGTESPPSQKERRAYMFFTGSLDRGHFELLEPLKNKVPVIPKGIYVAEQIGSTHPLSLVQRATGSEARLYPLDFPVSAADKANLLENANFLEAGQGMKRPPAETQAGEESASKRFIVEEGIANIATLVPPVCSSNSILLKGELESLHSEYLQELEFLKGTFESMLTNKPDPSNDPAVWMPVKNSDVLTFGRFRTAFLHFDPRSVTPMTPTNSAVSCLIYDCGSLRVTSMDEIEHVLDCSTKSGEFTLEKGKTYMLENPSKSPVMIRTTWLDQ